MRVHYIRASVFDTDYLQSVFRGNPKVDHTIGAFLDDNSESVGTGYERINCDSSTVVTYAMADKFDPDCDLSKDRKALLYSGVAEGFLGFIFDQAFVESKRETEAALLGIRFRNRIRVVIFRPGICIQFYSLHLKDIYIVL